MTKEVCANDFPYTFDGHIFNGAGTITDTIDGAGCDTIRTIIVNELPLETTLVVREVCANDFPYIFDGHVFNGAGTITDTIGGAGCDTIRTIVVNELPLQTTTVTKEVCANDFPYTFDGHVFNGAGTITDTIGGTVCDTIRTIIVNELPLQTTTVTTEVCANDFPYIFDGHIFNGAGTITDTIGGAGCDTIRTIVVNELPLLMTTVTKEVCANDFPYTFDGHIFNGAGTITDTIGGAG